MNPTVSPPLTTINGCTYPLTRAGRFGAVPPGYSRFMSSTSEQPDLSDVLTPGEEVHPDRHEHAKEGKHLDEAELERRTQHERDVVQGEPTT